MTLDTNIDSIFRPVAYFRLGVSAANIIRLEGSGPVGAERFTVDGVTYSINELISSGYRLLPPLEITQVVLEQYANADNWKFCGRRENRVQRVWTNTQQAGYVPAQQVLADLTGETTRLVSSDEPQ
ncbi:MAG: hypothetical protein AAGH78_00890 [Cyanobacteria bacterium P01_H01_bin.58]